VLKITDEIEEMMIKVQHWKGYSTHFGIEKSPLSSKLIELLSLIRSVAKFCWKPICVCTNLLIQISSKNYKSLENYRAEVNETDFLYCEDVDKAIDCLPHLLDSIFSEVY
jgi:hypothetical protein